MEIEFKKLEEEFGKDLSAVSDAAAIEALRVKYLGRKAEINRLFSLIPSLNKEEKGVWGRNLNILKNKISAAIEEKLKNLGGKEERIDLTYPAVKIKKGSRHILSAVAEEICSVFEKLGFTVVEGTEIEDEWHNFSALNIPLDHPSRDAFDTFYLDLPEPRKKQRGKFLLRSHTSPSQARVLSASKPPVAVVSPGRVYRPDSVDASHSFMFQQVEGFAVDENISFAHLKECCLILQSYFLHQTLICALGRTFSRLPVSRQVDISRLICKGQKR